MTPSANPRNTNSGHSPAKGRNGISRIPTPEASPQRSRIRRMSARRSANQPPIGPPTISVTIMAVGIPAASAMGQSEWTADANWTKVLGR